MIVLLGIDTVFSCLLTSNDDFVVCIGQPPLSKGTTSVRTLESLYWFGVRLLCEETKRKNNFFFVAQWEPYERLDELGENNLPTAAEALRAILKWNSEQGGNLRGQTRLLIVPGYQFQMYVDTLRNPMDAKCDIIYMIRSC